MSVPDYQSLMLPLLKLADDGQEKLLRETADALAEQLGLSDADLAEMLPSGRQAKFYNRVGWARTYLTKAGLLKVTARAIFRITERGLEVLKSNPDNINAKFLKQFPEFVEFQGTHRQQGETDGDAAEEESLTPEETLESSYQGLREDLAQQLLENVIRSSASFFETLVVDLLVAMGYGGSRSDAGKAIGRSGDEGIDGIIKEDKLGLDVVYIQAKKWEGTVGRPIVQAFAGSLEGFRARKGVLITTSHFSQDAKDYVGKIEKKIVLIDGAELTELMIDHDVGVTSVVSYTVKRMDLDYFDNE